MAPLQAKPEQSWRSKLSKLRENCDKLIATHHQKVDSSSSFFEKFLESQRDKVQLNLQNQAKLGKLKVELRELEDDLVRALSVKTRKEAKRIAVMDSLSETRVKVDELRKIVLDQAGRKEEYAAILSEQSEALAESEEQSREVLKKQEEMQEAFTWYNRVLGFRIDGGHGVTFTFTNINKECPDEEFSFSVRHADEKYTLLDCKPQLKGVGDLVHELNKSNGLFRFVRIMREKFQAASSGTVSHFIYQYPDCTSVSLSAPYSPVSSVCRSKSPLPLREINGDIKKANHGKGTKSPHLFLSPRRSPRLVAKKYREG